MTEAPYTTGIHIDFVPVFKPGDPPPPGNGYNDWHEWVSVQHGGIFGKDEIMTDRQEVKCPHPQCDAILKIPAHLPAGEYVCICKTCLVRLSWSTGVNMERRPSVELVTKDEVRP